MQLCICTCTDVFVMMLECKSRLVASFFNACGSVALNAPSVSQYITTKQSSTSSVVIFKRRWGLSPPPLASNHHHHPHLPRIGL